MTTQSIQHRLSSSPVLDVDSATRLHARLVIEAFDRGLLDVSYRTVDSPIGSLLLAATPQGVVRVAFDCEDHDHVLADLAAQVSPRILRAPSRLDDVARQLDEYFARRRQHFDVPLDWQLVAGFRLNVLTHLRDIAYGVTASYASVAAASGSPRATRAVGSACANNPLPLLVPCHRVVRSDGAVGNYRGGVEAKHTLLALESM
ncbi:MAG TPA: methylated-DNA--[protein]-cysteine S-methyltransferase [Acidimicrobiales bacterium]|jgi:methylated-DNA-[protein]-cysteine S-methyltransferase|nr:methylated-DNA--[protein]-cysteine S-methyltransferase [Acidimicrobiales bacterium]